MLTLATTMYFEANEPKGLWSLHTCAVDSRINAGGQSMK